MCEADIFVRKDKKCGARGNAVPFLSAPVVDEKIAVLADLNYPISATAP